MSRMYNKICVQTPHRVDPRLHALAGQVGGHVSRDVRLVVLLGLEVVGGRIRHARLGQHQAEEAGAVRRKAVDIVARRHARAERVAHHLVRVRPHGLLGLIGQVRAPVAAQVTGGGDVLDADAHAVGAGVDARVEQAREVAAVGIHAVDRLEHARAAELVFDVHQKN